MPLSDVLDLPGSPESRLGAETAARLPGTPAPAPWSTRMDAVVWWHRATPAAAAQIAPALRSLRRVPVTLGAFVFYADTPVGPYGEVLGIPVVLLDGLAPRGTVPFMAVDSLASVLGGRANWGYPKVLAGFSREGSVTRASGETWRVQARVTARPRRVPAALAGATRQVRAGGEVVDVVMRGRTRARLASVEVETDGPSLPRWLVAGRHPALVLEDGRFRFAPARPVQGR